METSRALLSSALPGRSVSWGREGPWRGGRGAWPSPRRGGSHVLRGGAGLACLQTEPLIISWDPFPPTQRLHADSETRGQAATVSVRAKGHAVFCGRFAEAALPGSRPGVWGPLVRGPSATPGSYLGKPEVLVGGCPSPRLGWSGSSWASLCGGWPRSKCPQGAKALLTIPLAHHFQEDSFGLADRLHPDLAVTVHHLPPLFCLSSK